jgi:hypothetical protein
MVGMAAISRCTPAVILAALFALGAPGRSAVRAATWEVDTLATVGNVGSRCEIVRDAGGDLHVAYIRPDADELVVLSRVAGVWQLPATVAGNV